LRTGLENICPFIGVGKVFTDAFPRFQKTSGKRLRGKPAGKKPKPPKEDYGRESLLLRGIGAEVSD
jgi:hypothetical protein